MHHAIDVMISQQQIEARVNALAAQINHDYQHAGSGLMLVCLLKGSFIFLADLCRQIYLPHQVEFMTVSSYGANTKSSGQVHIIQDLLANIKNRHVIIVEDIIDTGHTLSYIKNLLEQRQPASLEICTLIDKPSRREIEVAVKYIGFSIRDQFIVGYGLDYNQFYRHLPYIGIVRFEAE